MRQLLAEFGPTSTILVEVSLTLGFMLLLDNFGASLVETGQPLNQLEEVGFAANLRPEAPMLVDIRAIWAPVSGQHCASGPRSRLRAGGPAPL